MYLYSKAADIDCSWHFMGLHLLVFFLAEIIFIPNWILWSLVRPLWFWGLHIAVRRSLWSLIGPPTRVLTAWFNFWSRSQMFRCRTYISCHMGCGYSHIQELQSDCRRHDYIYALRGSLLVRSGFSSIPEQSVACVWCTHYEVQGMLPSKSSEDLEIRSFSFN